MNERDIKREFVISLLVAIALIFINPLLTLLRDLVDSLSAYSKNAIVDYFFQKVSEGKFEYGLVTVFALFGIMFTATYLSMLKLNILQSTKKTSHATIRGETIKKEKNYSIVTKFFKVLTIVNAVIVLSLMVSEGIKVSIINNFERRVKILTPYISSQDKDKLISKFNLMQGSADYYSINEQLEKFAMNNEIHLP